MRNVVLILVALLVSFSINAQVVQADVRLEEKYSKEDLKLMEKENPDHVAFLNYCLDNAFYIGDYPAEKDGKFELDGKLEIEDLESINIFKLGIELKDGRNQTYSVNGKSKLLIVYDSKFVEDKFRGASK